MDTKTKKKLINAFRKHPEIQLAYIFGSQAREETSSLSDYDFAFSVQNIKPVSLFRLRSQILKDVSIILKTNNIDIIFLHQVQNPDLKYAIILEGDLLFEREPYRTIIEPGILNEYFDFQMLLQRHGLTEASI